MTYQRAALPTTVLRANAVPDRICIGNNMALVIYLYRFMKEGSSIGRGEGFSHSSEIVTRQPPVFGKKVPGSIQRNRKRGWCLGLSKEIISKTYCTPSE